MLDLSDCLMMEEELKPFGSLALRRRRTAGNSVAVSSDARGAIQRIRTFPLLYFAPVSVAALRQTLVDLPRAGTLIKDRGYRQVWRFQHEGQAYFLKFYRRRGFRDRFRRVFRGSPAMAEFKKLQLLQKAL